jgi:hypothetical protein
MHACAYLQRREVEVVTFHVWVDEDHLDRALDELQPLLDGGGEVPHRQGLEEIHLGHSVLKACSLVGRDCFRRAAPSSVSRSLSPPRLPRTTTGICKSRIFGPGAKLFDLCLRLRGFQPNPMPMGYPLTADSTTFPCPLRIFR